jgi:ankyrin repeat protein
MSNLFNKEIGQMKMHTYNNLINVGDKYYRFIGLQIGSFRISKEGKHEYSYNLLDIQLYDACYGGHLDIVKLMIEMGADGWHLGLYYACQCRNDKHLDIIKLMIERGANDWNLGLRGACSGGHLDIVKLMIEKGANDLATGLYYARLGGSGEHLDIIKFMIERGADD